MAIGDPKTQSKMDKEIAALRRQHRAGKLTDFKLRHGIKKIKEKYGKAEPSTVTKVISFLTKPSPNSAIARAKAKETSKKTTVSDAQKRGQLGKKKAPLLPKSPPKRPKTNTSKTTKKSEKTYHQINVQTGKVDFNKPKVTAAQRLKQEDKHKAFKKLNKAAKESLKKKGK